MLDASSKRSRAAIGVGSEETRLHNIGPKCGDVFLQTKIGCGIELPMLTNDCDSHSGSAYRFFIRSATSEGRDMHVGPFPREGRRQQRELLFGATTVERRDDEQN